LSLLSSIATVRVVDVFVDELDFGRLGFEGVDPAATGLGVMHAPGFSVSQELRP
jgi:hypothetical protein